jgi:hypothetical protein
VVQVHLGPPSQDPSDYPKCFFGALLLAWPGPTNRLQDSFGTHLSFRVSSRSTLSESFEPPPNNASSRSTAASEPSSKRPPYRVRVNATLLWPAQHRRPGLRLRRAHYRRAALRARWTTFTPLEGKWEQITDAAEGKPCSLRPLFSGAATGVRTLSGSGGLSAPDPPESASATVGAATWPRRLIMPMLRRNRTAVGTGVRGGRS